MIVLCRLTFATRELNEVVLMIFGFTVLTDPISILTWNKAQALIYVVFSAVRVLLAYSLLEIMSGFISVLYARCAKSRPARGKSETKVSSCISFLFCVETSDFYIYR